MTDLGQPLRARFLLEEGAVFLNHGSFGAAPDSVREAQAAWRDRVDRQPDVFFRETIWTATRAAADTIGDFVNAPGNALVFVPNVTEAVAVVLDAMRFALGDEIVLLDVAYAAVRRAVNVTCDRTGTVVKTLPTTLQMANADWEASLAAVLTPKTRLVLLDHIVSPTAQRVPVERLVPVAKAAGARVFIDGAHALGQVDLDLSGLGADWYASNAHKWLFAPRGSCVLYAAPEVREETRPVIVSHYYEDAYPRRFDYVGTRDVTAYLASAEACRFVQEIGWPAIDAHRAMLTHEAEVLMTRLRATPVTEAAPALRAWALPQSRAADPADGPALMAALWKQHRVQVASSSANGTLLLRLSLQLYNDAEDITALGAALDADDWPGR